jgi:uncharacterized protein YjbJ (UPF0337 family)
VVQSRGAVKRNPFQGRPDRLGPGGGRSTLDRVGPPTRTAASGRNPTRAPALTGRADRWAARTEENLMNWDQIEGKWKEMTGAAQKRWGKLTDNDLQEIKGDRRELAGKIQTAYGVSKDEAEKQIDDWMAEPR